MTAYCGVDFHVRRQAICFCDSAGEEPRLAELRHDRDDVRGFYAQFTGEVVVGIEAGGYGSWFVELLEGLGHRVLVGDAAGIRRRAGRRQKNDRRDASLIPDLLLEGESPQVHRPPFESREVLRLLRYRHKLVQMRPPRQEQPASVGLRCRLAAAGASAESAGAGAALTVADGRGDEPAAG